MKRRSGDEAPPDEIMQPAQADAISALVEFVSTHAQDTGFEDKRVKEIELALEEALTNIIKFACPNGTGEIRITCSVHDSGSLIINIIDSGVPFNMLLASTFPETQDFTDPGQIPSTKVMKKAIKNIEYIRGPSRNTLIFTVSPIRGK